MRTLQDFANLIQNICKRHHMYVCGGSFYEVCAFLHGYATAIDPCPLGSDHETSFSTFVATQLGYPDKLAWPFVLKTASRNDDHAIGQLRDFMTEYVDAVRDNRVEDVMAKARAKLASREQNPPSQVTCWRRFCHALNHGDKDTLESLILNHVTS
jgi:hypothetical protein